MPKLKNILVSILEAGFKKTLVGKVILEMTR